MEYAPHYEAQTHEAEKPKKKNRVRIGDDPSMREYVMASMYDNNPDFDPGYQEAILSETTKKMLEHD